MQFQPVSPDQPNLPLAPRLLTENCQEYGARLCLDPQFHYFGYIETREGLRLPIKGGALPLNSYAAGEAARDKDFCGRLIQSAGLPTPSFKLVHSKRAIAQLHTASPHVAKALNSIDNAADLAGELGFPLYLKPNEGTQGIGVQKLTKPEQLPEALEKSLQANDRVLLQKAVSGRDYRIIVLDEKILAVIERRPLSILGDGHSPVKTLLEEKKASLKTRGGGQKIEQDDPRILQMLSEAKLTLASVLKKEQELQLLPNANLSTGGQAIDMTDHISPVHAQLALNAAKACGLRYAGVDLLCNDITLPTSSAHVLELNAGPGLTNFWQSAKAHEDRVREIFKSLAQAILQEAHTLTFS